MKVFLASFFLLLFSGSSEGQQVIRVGAKHFNEGYILSEMIAQILEDGGYSIERKFNLGGTAVSFEALRTAAIDVYPEYTGTIAAEILKSKTTMTNQKIQQLVNKEFHLEISKPYGFNNSYALVLSRKSSETFHLKAISDLQNHRDLKIGLSYEFLERNDGWRNLAKFYQLPQHPFALEHGLAYKAILENKIELTDAYSTDGEISKYNFTLLMDDKNILPTYEAVSFYSAKLPDQAKQLLHQLDNQINEDEMQKLNALSLFENKGHYEIAHDFLTQKGLLKNSPQIYEANKISAILSKTWEHIILTMVALLASIIFAVPVGIVIYRSPRFSAATIYAAGLLQTIPSIALLALMIPFAGIGKLPAVIALFLYALLQILRNTVMGLSTVDPALKKTATAIGLNPWQKMKLVELPLAMPMMLTGIRTAAVINVGTATLAAFIGAGGLGEFIVTGLALNNTKMILTGAIPAALLAVVTELIFEGIEGFTIPMHLRQKPL